MLSDLYRASLNMSLLLDSLAFGQFNNIIQKGDTFKVKWNDNATLSKLWEYFEYSNQQLWRRQMFTREQEKAAKQRVAQHRVTVVAVPDVKGWQHKPGPLGSQREALSSPLQLPPRSLFLSRRRSFPSSFDIFGNTTKSDWGRSKTKRNEWMARVLRRNDVFPGSKKRLDENTTD